MDEQKTPLPDYYGTGRQPVCKKSRTGWIVSLIVLLLVANVTTLAVFLGSGQGGVSAAPADDDLNPIPDATQQATQTRKDETLTLSELYDVVAPATASVQGSVNGTAIVLTQDGFLLTNAYVVGGAETVYVSLSGGETYTAELCDTDDDFDLALLKIDADGLETAQFCAQMPRVGDPVVALSNLFGGGLSGTMTEGMVCAVNSGVQIGGQTADLLQTNAAASTKNPGGPLYDRTGSIVAFCIRAAGGYTSYESAETIGFALPVAQLGERIQRMMLAYDGAQRASLGISIVELSEGQRLYWGLPEGVMIKSISTGGSAYAAGLRLRDMIISIGSTDVTDAETYRAALAQYHAGQTVRVIIYRHGAYYYADIPLDAA